MSNIILTFEKNDTAQQKLGGRGAPRETDLGS